MASVGIDFGTTNSVVAVFDKGKVEVLEVDAPSEAEWAHLGFSAVMPTLYGVDENGEILIGWAAKEAAAGSNGMLKVEAVKRMFQGEDRIAIDGREVYAEEVATSIFSFIKKKAELENVKISKSVVTIPANSKALPRYKTKISAGMAGIQVSALINEPTAAAMSYAYNMPFDQTIMVVDWGGGTLDVTLLQAESGIFIEVASKGVAKNGGIDFDRKIASRIFKDLGLTFNEGSSAMNAFMVEVEKAKIRLSKMEKTELAVPGKGMYTLTREKVSDWVSELIAQVESPVGQVLKESGTNGEEIDALLLVGGTCSMPAVRDFIQNILPEVNVPGDVNPMTAIAEGAAVASAILNGEAEDKGFFVATEHALGTLVVEPEDEETIRYAEVTGEVKRKFSSIIGKNHKLPARKTKTYYPISEQSTAVEVQVVEGEEGLFEDDENVVSYIIPDGTELIGVDTSHPDPGVDVTFEYDSDGVIHVSLSSRSTGEEKSFTVTTGMGLNPEMLIKMSKTAKEQSEKALNSKPEPKPSKTKVEVGEFVNEEQLKLITSVEEKIIPFLSENETAEIRTVIAELKTAPDVDTADTLEKQLRALIEEYLFLL